jgi:hypothetical protein
MTYRGFKLSFLAIALATTSAVASAQTSTPAEDPRICLLDQASPADKKAHADRVTRWLDKAPGETGHTLDQISAAMADRCIVTRKWHPAYRRAAQSLALREGFVRVLRPRLQQQSLDVAGLDNFIRDLPYGQLGEYESLNERYSSFAKNWQVATAKMSQKPNGDAQKALVIEYLSNRAEAEQQLRNFGRLNGPQANQFLYENWQILPALEASRPVIRERTLSAPELAEVAKFRKLYFTLDRDGGNRLVHLQRLVELGQSGNREAMIAARDALGKGPPWEMEREYLNLNLNNDHLRLLTSRLAAIWTAMIWSRFGYDDSGRQYMAACVGGLFGEVYKDKKRGVAAYLHNDGTVRQVNSNGLEMDTTVDGCGFTLLGKSASAGVPKGAQVLQYYNKSNSFGAAGDRRPTGDFYITGAQFSPVMGDRAFVEQKFSAHLALRRKGIVYTKTGGYNFATPTWLVTKPWYERYALDTGRLGLLQEADAATVKAIADQRVAILLEWENSWQKAKDAFQADPYNQANRDKLQSLASAHGGPKWTEFQRLVPDWQGSAVIGPAQPNGSAGGGYSGGNNSVEVRSYNNSGTYTGSTRVSAVWADIMKMTSTPPR